MANILCKLGIHRPLFGHKNGFSDVVSGRRVHYAKCSCGINWMTDSIFGWFGSKIKGTEQDNNGIDIFKTKPGDFIEFNTVDAGMDEQKEDIQERLFLHQRYEVERIEISSWHTDVYLVGFDKPFNSVFFVNVNDYTGFKLKED